MQYLTSLRNLQCMFPVSINLRLQSRDSSMLASKNLRGGGRAEWCVDRFFLLKHGNTVFFEGGTIGKHAKWNHDPELFQRWKDGQTGMPLVDANMRELKHTGSLSPKNLPLYES